jgi:hypothetical protein
VLVAFHSIQFGSEQPSTTPTISVYSSHRSTLILKPTPLLLPLPKSKPHHHHIFRTQQSPTPTNQPTKMKLITLLTLSLCAVFATVRLPPPFSLPLPSSAANPNPNRQTTTGTKGSSIPGLQAAYTATAARRLPLTWPITSTGRVRASVKATLRYVLTSRMA